MNTRPEATPPAQAAMQQFHTAIVDEVRAAVARDAVVVVGMGWNPLCKKAREALDSAGIAHTYLEYGNYLSMWRPRLAIKLWSGWPTFPQVFVNGGLVGGNSDLRHALDSGAFREWLAAGR